MSFDTDLTGVGYSTHFHPTEGRELLSWGLRQGVQTPPRLQVLPVQLRLPPQIFGLPLAPCRPLLTQLPSTSIPLHSSGHQQPPPGSPSYYPSLGVRQVIHLTPQHPRMAQTKPPGWVHKGKGPVLIEDSSAPGQPGGPVWQIPGLTPSSSQGSRTSAPGGQDVCFPGSSRAKNWAWRCRCFKLIW